MSHIEGLNTPMPTILQKFFVIQFNTTYHDRGFLTLKTKREMKRRR